MEILDNVADPDVDVTVFTFTVFSPPINGALSLLAFTYSDLEEGNVVYQHDNSETTSDSFTLEVSDGERSDLLVVNIIIILRVILGDSFE